ncbi:MAG: MFS transporter [Candidatus Lokiarchaeota archaeon]|nr:MFS transporter [Candidatus Lokiarchaeota archaeon]MBD3337931.1 MFS transporter [Candidatus Lokiarchaeota archaeon]
MTEEEKFSKVTFFSYALGNLLITLLGVVSDTRLFIFYETEIGLPATFILVAFVIYGIWNMVNDPLMGFISDRKNALWQRWGRRFPWILIGGLLYCIFFVMLFTPPTEVIIFLFIYLVFITCLVDLLLSMWTTNYYALYTDKFRSQEVRTKVSGIAVILGIIGITVGTLIPPLIIEYGNRQSYIIAAGSIALIGLVIIFLMIPGIRENEKMIARAMSDLKDEKVSFWKELKNVLKKRNFVAFLFANTAWQIVVVIMLTSVPYLNQYVFRQPASSEILITASLLVGSIGSVPIWVRFARKKGNRATTIIGLFLMAFTLFPLLFIPTLLGAAFVAFLIGIGNGAIYVATYPMLSDVIDEIVVLTSKRKEGIYIGIRTFFMRLSYISQAIIFTIVHVLTGFNPIPGAEQSPLALFGIRLHSSIIPMIILIVGGLVFWKLCDLRPDKVKNIKEKLVALKI